MFQFENIQILWFLPVLVLLIAWQYWYLNNKKSRLEKIGDYSVLRRLFADWSKKKEWLKFLFVFLAFVCMIIAWANPQWGNKKENVKARSADIVIALDISQSMMAEDVSPNRMERAKRFVGRLLKELRGERVGLIFFAGSAYLQMPLSHDLASAELFIKAASPEQAGTQGTVIADAIELSENIFGSEADAQKALIIISDGENHESAAIEAARNARENGTFVYTLGIGSREGAFIPVIEQGRKVYKRDNAGNPVRTIPDTGLLNQIADAGGGEFYMIDQSLSAINDLKSEIERIEKREVEQRSFTEYNSYFQYFLFCALILILADIFTSNISRRKSSWRRNLGLEK